MDDKVRTVVANWSARFVANDLSPLDVERTLTEVDGWDTWADAWERSAEVYVRAADVAAEDGHELTAAQHRRRAALTLQFAQFVLNDDPPRRAALHARQCALYASAAGNLVPPAVPYLRQVGDAVVQGYVRLPPSPRPCPAVLLVPGLESTKEQFSTYEPYFLARGVATISVEGPGQGEAATAHRFDLATWLRAFADAVTFARDHVDLDGERLAVVGTSFGGLLALRAAADTPELACVVDIAGPHTLLPLEDLQPVLQEGFMALVDAPDLATAAQRLANVTLTGVLDVIDVPTLIVHGDADRIISVTHGDRIAAELGGRATYDRVPGGTHSCNNLHTLIRPRVADWVSDQLTGCQA